MNLKSEKKMSNHGLTRMDTDENSSKPVQAFPIWQGAMHILNVLILAIIRVHPCPSVVSTSEIGMNQTRPDYSRAFFSPDSAWDDRESIRHP